MTLRLGILSTAHINRLVIAGARESDRVEVTAVASRDLARAETYGREWDIERAYGSYEELLADPDVDAVYIPLPNSMHVEWSIRALEAGKHVLCEKPLSRRPDDVERAFDVADREGRILTEAFMYRHNPQTARHERTGRRRCDRRAPSCAGGVQLHHRRSGEHPARGRSRRRCADGRRLLLRQRLQVPRGRARERVRHERDRGGSRHRLRGHDVLSGRCDRAVRLRVQASDARRVGSGGVGRVALPRRSVALPQSGDRAAARGRASRRSPSNRSTRTGWSSRISPTRSAGRASCSSAATTPCIRRAQSTPCTAQPTRARPSRSSPRRTCRGHVLVPGTGPWPGGAGPCGSGRNGTTGGLWTFGLQKDMSGGHVLTRYFWTRPGAPNCCSTSGTSPWKFSRIASAQRSVTAVPFSVWTNSVPPLARYRIPRRRAW